MNKLLYKLLDFLPISQKQTFNKFNFPPQQVYWSFVGGGSDTCHLFMLEIWEKDWGRNDDDLKLYLC
jgi:hypothetical protein